MLKFILALLRRDFLVGMRKWATWAEPFIFFTITLVLFPLAGSADGDMLEKPLPAIVWISVLFANFLVLERLLKPDFDDGSLEQLLIAPYPLGVIVLSKVLAHWSIFSLPLVVLAPAYSLLLFLPLDAVGVMALALAAGTLTMNLIGSIGTALIVTLHGNNLLSGLPGGAFLYSGTGVRCPCHVCFESRVGRKRATRDLVCHVTISADSGAFCRCRCVAREYRLEQGCHDQGNFS